MFLAILKLTYLQNFIFTKWKTIWDRTSWYVKHFWSSTKYFSKQQPLLGNWELIDSKPCLNCSIPADFDIIIKCCLYSKAFLLLSWVGWMLHLQSGLLSPDSIWLILSINSPLSTNCGWDENNAGLFRDVKWLRLTVGQLFYNVSQPLTPSLTWKVAYFHFQKKVYAWQGYASLQKAKTLDKALHHQLMAPLPKQHVSAF